MINDQKITSYELSEAIQSLRDEIRTDVAGLSQSIERESSPRSTGTPLFMALTALGAFVIGVAGASLYFQRPSTGAHESPAHTPADIRSEVLTAMAPQTGLLEQQTQTLVGLSQMAANEATAQQLALTRLTEAVSSLQATLEQRLESSPALVAKSDDAAGVPQSQESSEAASQPRLAARPLLSDTADPAATNVGNTEQADEAAEPSPDSVVNNPVTETEPGVDPSSTPTPPTPAESNRGRLVITNPSRFELRLLVNDTPLEIKARGVTTVEVSVGTLTTQIAGIPQTLRQWDQWEVVDGQQQLSIRVEADAETYVLR